MRWADWLRTVQAVEVDERLLCEPARASAAAGEIARRAARDLPFGTSPTDFVREFAGLAQAGLAEEAPRE